MDQMTLSVDTLKGESSLIVDDLPTGLRLMQKLSPEANS